MRPSDAAPASVVPSRGGEPGSRPPFEAVRDLFESTAGDEKHDPCARSVLDVLWVLYDRVLRHDPSDPHWEERDRFLLSKGHGPLALYAVLAARGFFPVAWLATFLAWDSPLGGHPDRHLVPGVEMSSGSLGHGLPMAVGVALALRARRSGSHVYALIGDGESHEGSVWESLLLAGALGLSNLCAILIDNHSSTLPLGDMAARFGAFGWWASAVSASDHAGLEHALLHREPGRPTALVVDWRPERWA